MEVAEPDRKEMTMSMNGDMGTFDQAVQILRELEAQADSEVEAQEQILASAKAAQRRVKAMLKAAGVIEEAKPKRTKAKHASEETNRAVLAAIYEHVKTRPSTNPSVPGSFSVPSLLEVTDLHQSTVKVAVNALREQGRLRACGQYKPEGTKGIPPMTYALDETYGNPE